MHASLSDIIADVAANSIEARAKKVVVEVLEENGTIVLRVEDNGKGMPPEIVAKAFDPFYTEPGKHDKRKVGMGLPFVKQTCDGCGGSVKLESTQGVGTTLVCTFKADNIDLPPMGSLPQAILSLFNFQGDYDLLFRHEARRRYLVEGARSASLIDASNCESEVVIMPIPSRFAASTMSSGGWRS